MLGKMPFLAGSSVDASLNAILNGSVAGLTLEKVLRALIVALVCLVVIKIVLRLVDGALNRAAQLDAMVRRLLRNAIKAVLLCVMVLVVLGCLDIPVTSLVALLSVAGLALSLALQNFLSNVAGGLQILASKPFTLGDYVDAGGCSGTVTEIGLFYTKLNTTDNKRIQIPNSAIVDSNITNYSVEEKRQVEWKVTASYDADTEHVKAVLACLVAEHPLAHKENPPMVRVCGYHESAIEYVVRTWCNNSDYWTVYFDVMDQLKATFDKEGIEMTYPHLNVHMLGGRAQP